VKFEKLKNFLNQGEMKIRGKQCDKSQGEGPCLIKVLEIMRNGCSYFHFSLIEVSLRQKIQLSHVYQSILSQPISSIP